jgi:flagellar motor switch protein FliM
VTARDFAQPKRLGPARAAELLLALKNLMPSLERKLHDSAGLRLGCKLAGLAEVDADSIFTTATEPLCVLRWRTQGAPGWLVWESSAAVNAVETLLGAKGGASAARKLSPTETRVVAQFLTEIVRLLAGALGVSVADFAFVQVASELGSWRETSKDVGEPEAHRLAVKLEVAPGTTTSALSLYFPGCNTKGENSLSALPANLPGHLEQVEVELSATLEGCELSLEQLLALETGDVIPLDARLGDPTSLRVEGLALAQARLGSHRGRLAVRIESLNVHAENAV